MNKQSGSADVPDQKLLHLVDNTDNARAANASVSLSNTDFGDLTCFAACQRVEKCQMSYFPDQSAARRFVASPAFFKALGADAGNWRRAGSSRAAASPARLAAASSLVLSMYRQRDG